MQVFWFLIHCMSFCRGLTFRDRRIIICYFGFLGKVVVFRSSRDFWTPFLKFLKPPRKHEKKSEIMGIFIFRNLFVIGLTKQTRRKQYLQNWARTWVSRRYRRWSRAPRARPALGTLLPGIVTNLSKQTSHNLFKDTHMEGSQHKNSEPSPSFCLNKNITVLLASV